MKSGEGQDKINKEITARIYLPRTNNLAYTNWFSSYVPYNIKDFIMVDGDYNGTSYLNHPYSSNQGASDYMEDFIYLGRGHELQQVSQAMWKQHLAQIPEHRPERLHFMTEAHHLVRNFVVVELAKRRRPLEPKLIAESLNLPPDLVHTILDELEKNLTFLVRNAQGAVSWAYPVTVEVTPHPLRFSSGEQLYAA